MKTKNFVLIIALSCFSIITPLISKLRILLFTYEASTAISVIGNYFLIYCVSTIIFLVIVYILQHVGLKEKFKDFYTLSAQFAATYLLSSIPFFFVIYYFNELIPQTSAWDYGTFLSFGILPNISVRLINYPINIIGSIFIPSILGFSRGYIFGLGLLFINLRTSLPKEFITRPITFALTSSILSVFASLISHLWFPKILIGKIIYDLCLSLIYLFIFILFEKWMVNEDGKMMS